MEPEWDSYESDVATGDLLGELDRIRGEWEGRSPVRKPVGKPLKRGAKIALTIVSVTIAMGVVTAVALFAHVVTFTSSAKLTTGCPTPTGAVTGSMIVFTCAAPPTIGVSTGSSGTVSYSAFGVLPPNVSDAYLIDTQATLAASCSATTGAGMEPVGPLNTSSGGSVSIGTNAGNLRPGHNYNYCMDFATLPPTFTSAVTWSQ